MDSNLYELHIESFNGIRWRRQCVADEATCFKIADELDGEHVVFHTTQGSTRKATGKRMVYFLRPSAVKAPTLTPTRYRYTYCG